MGRELRLASTQESMHALGEGVAKAEPMPIRESNHNTAQPRHVLIQQLASHGHLRKSERAQESQMIKDHGRIAHGLLHLPLEENDE